MGQPELLATRVIHQAVASKAACTVFRLLGPRLFAIRPLLKLQGRVRELCCQTGPGQDASGSWPPSTGAFPGHLLSAVDAAVVKQYVTKHGRQCTSGSAHWMQACRRAITAALADSSPAVSVTDGLHRPRRFGSWWCARPHGRRVLFREQLANVFTAENLQKCARHKDAGPAGVDGWAGSEISTWPQAVWQAFSALVLRWLRRGLLPRVSCQARQVHIPKGEPRPAEGALRRDQLRLITVLLVQRSFLEHGGLLLVLRLRSSRASMRYPGGGLHLLILQTADIKVLAGPALP